MPNRKPVIASLNGDGVTFDAGGAPVRLDALSNAAVSDPDPFGFEVIRVATGLGNGPLFMVEVPDGSGRMYEVEKNGAIRILDPATGTVAATPFLNVAGEIMNSGEQGLLGFALAPDFATSGTFYIYMTNLAGDNEVRRYGTLPGNLNQADPATADRILLLPHPTATNHNAGWISFGPDGMLYVATGDGAVQPNAQSLDSLLGKILRIDPGTDDFPADADRDYAIPAGNPYAGATAGRDEIWASGLRNPYRNSFDPLTGTLWIGDVGESRREEIDLAPAGQAGMNFGWNLQEGTTGANNPAFTRPVAEYLHGTGPFQGNSLTGGLVYRGPIAGLDGHYLFGDYFDQVWSIPASALVQGTTMPSSGFTLRNTAFTPDAGTVNRVTSFATDAAGTLYITDLGGEIFRVQASAAPNFAGGRLSATIGAGAVPAEDRLGFATGAVTLSDGTNFASQVRVEGVLVGTIAPGGTGANGEPLVVLFSSGATQARITTLVEAVTYANAAVAPTPGTRSVTIALNDGVGIGGGGEDTAIVTTAVAVSAGAGGTLSGTAGDDVLVGGIGGDSLDGGAGADTLVGRGGDDLFRVDDAGDVVTEGAGEGADDRILASASYTLGAGVHVERLAADNPAGTAAIALTGNELVNLITGNAGANLLDGRGASDTLVGLGGDDSYYVDSAGDTVIEGVGEGAGDRILASASYTQGAGVYVERLTTDNDAGTAAIALTGNELANILQGNAGANVLDGKGGANTLIGLGGDDWYYISNAADVVIEGAGEGTSDRVSTKVSYTLGAGVYVEKLTTYSSTATTAINLTGNELANMLYGNAGANVLDGKGAADTMTGLGGDDRYHVDNAADVVNEGASEGALDRVYASVSYALGAGVYVEQLLTDNDAGTTTINLTGNELANQITGNAEANVLDGKGGADTLVGLGGDDSYYVDSAGDVVTESAGEGANDRIFASVSYTQGAGVHVERLTTDNDVGTVAINLTGNELVNILQGNAGANVLDGKGGANTLIGLGGDDWYYVSNAADAVIEGAGEGANDRVFTKVSYVLGAGVYVEKLTTYSNTATTAINLTGNELANMLYGNAGANVLDGKGGNDTLFGLGGEDAFAFTTALGPGNVDTLGDFAVADDTIRLDDAVFAGLAAGALPAGAFTAGAAAADADDRVIYNSATGALSFDADGVGGAAAVQFAALGAGLGLTSSDFVVI